jgi:molybdopterin-guanine dinucleotide biosynthesis protein A
MGRDKSFLACPDGTSYVQHALQRMVPICDVVGISCREAVEHIETKHHVIRDPVAHQGPAMGIATSLRFARLHDCQACLITPVDLPNLTTNDLLKIKRVWQQSRLLTVAEADRLQPLVAVYPVELLHELGRLAGSDDRSLMTWMQTQPCVNVQLSAFACHNVNTPEDSIDDT